MTTKKKGIRVQGTAGMETVTNQDVLKQFEALYHEVFAHDGYGDIRLEMRILRRGQKEVIIHCGKQYRFVVDFANAGDRSGNSTAPVRAGKIDGTKAQTH